MEEKEREVEKGEQKAGGRVKTLHLHVIMTKLQWYEHLTILNYEVMYFKCHYKL